MTKGFPCFVVHALDLAARTVSSIAKASQPGFTKHARFTYQVQSDRVIRNSKIVASRFLIRRGF